MVTSAAVGLLILLAALAVFQVALACGAPLGRFAWGGQHRVLPTRLRLGSLSSVLIYALIAAIVTARAGLVDVDVSDRVVQVAAWGVAAYLLLGVGVDAASRSKPERTVMTPLCAVLGVMSVGVALG